MIKTFRLFIWTVFVLALAGLATSIFHGFPICEFGIKLKNIKKFFLLVLFSGLALILVHPGCKKRWQSFWDYLDRVSSGKGAIFLLTFAYALLFIWQQVTEYLALRINFIPFGFYDYMFYHFWDSGKINYTGLLHGYYHLNTILLFFSPLWKLFSSPILLVVIYGPVVAAAAIPLFFWIRRLIPENPSAALITAFVYLNYRYLDNLLMMNFCIEAFYPLIILSAVYFGASGQWKKYYLTIVLGLLVKEDAFFYLSATSLIFLFSRKNWTHGIVTIAVVLGGAFLNMRIFAPLTENTILERTITNYSEHGNSVSVVIASVLSNPVGAVMHLFNSYEKLNTFFDLFYRLLFIPVFSPALALVCGSVFPLFYRVTGRDMDFYQLHYQYTAAVIPFVFIAFGYGLKNVRALLGRINTVFLFPILLVVVVAANGASYRSAPITRENIKSIQWAKKIPEKKNLNLVTHGHLLPYTPYRQYNYYFAPFLENPNHPYHRPYSFAEYYLIDTHVDPYPVDAKWVNEKKEQLLNDDRYVLDETDGTRFLFRRRDVK